MKSIILGVIVITGILVAVFVDYTPKGSVSTPEVQKTGNYERPVKDGNCWIQTDTAGNKMRVCF